MSFSFSRLARKGLSTEDAKYSRKSLPNSGTLCFRFFLNLVTCRVPTMSTQEDYDHCNKHKCAGEQHEPSEVEYVGIQSGIHASLRRTRPALQLIRLRSSVFPVAYLYRAINSFIENNLSSSVNNGCCSTDSISAIHPSTAASTLQAISLATASIKLLSTTCI